MWRRNCTGLLKKKKKKEASLGVALTATRMWWDGRMMYIFVQKHGADLKPEHVRRAAMKCRLCTMQYGVPYSPSLMDCELPLFSSFDEK